MTHFPKKKTHYRVDVVVVVILCVVIYVHPFEDNFVFYLFIDRKQWRGKKEQYVSMREKII